MNDDVKRAVYINLLLLAMADGRIAPEERAYLQRFASSAGVTAEQAATWQREIRDGSVGFVPIPEGAVVDDALAIVARMVRVDEQFDAAEQEAYVNLGKAVGVSQDALGAALRKVWNADPDALLQPPTQETGTPDSPSGEVIWVVEPGFADRVPLMQAAPGCKLGFVSLTALNPSDAAQKIILFHASEDRARSKEILGTLKARFPDAKIAFVARRDQSAQIGWLLGMGAHRCFVEPLYPKEIGRAVPELLAT